jgi:predicted nicotinamide N-methyase
LEAIRLHLADDVWSLWRKLQARQGAPGQPPFWAFPWAGGQGLARYVLEHPEVVRGERVLDFASGSGLVGIAAMTAGAASCLCTDTDPFALEAARLNAELNAVTLTAAPDDASAPDVDLVLCGDVFYEEDMAAEVLRRLDRHRAQGRRVLVGDPGRAHLPQEELDPVAAYEVPVIRALEDAPVKTASVYRLRRGVRAISGS